MTQADNLYEFTGEDCTDGIVDINPRNRHASARPDENYVADGLEWGYIVQRSDVVSTQIALADDGSEDWRGVLIEDQLQQADGNYNRCRPLTFTTDGQVRIRAGEALAVDTLVCSDATGRLRAYVDGVDDARALIGRTKSSCTDAGELVEVAMEGGG